MVAIARGDCYLLWCSFWSTWKCKKLFSHSKVWGVVLRTAPFLLLSLFAEATFTNRFKNEFGYSRFPCGHWESVFSSSTSYIAWAKRLHTIPHTPWAFHIPVFKVIIKIFWQEMIGYPNSWVFHQISDDNIAPYSFLQTNCWPIYPNVIFSNWQYGSKF